MKATMKVLNAILAISTLVSCGNTYNINGTSNVSMMDGQKLYLQVPDGDNWKHVDSCDVIHGEFSFAGRMDSAKWATIYLDDQTPTIPLILEDGDITVKINDAPSSTTRTGTPLNDKLNEFLRGFYQIDDDYENLESRHSQYIMDGLSEDEANRRIAAASAKLDQKIDDLVMKYVTDNFDNVLGPGIFIMVAQALYPQPILTPWVEDVMSKATPQFKNNHYIKEYMESAKRLEDISTGMAAPAPQYNGQDAAGTGDVPAAPTPNEMAGDSTKNSK
jgi:hypothetical protein